MKRDKREMDIIFKERLSTIKLLIRNWRLSDYVYINEPNELTEDEKNGIVRFD